MSTFIESLNNLAAAWAPAMAAIAVQVIVLAVLAAVACRVLRRHSPALRYWIWLALAAKLLVAPLWTAHVTLPAWLSRPAAPTVEAENFTATNSRAPASTFASTPLAAHVDTAPPSALAAPQVVAGPALTWQCWLLVAWLPVVAVQVIRTAWQFRQLSQLLAASTAGAAPLTALVVDCARQIGLRTPPAVRLVAVDGSPMVCGPRRPVLLLPASLAAALDTAALRQIVLHELAHIRRRDLATIWIIHAMRTVYWFHPVAHWIAYRAGLERELACDELALMHSGATAANYARTLISAVSRAAQPAVLTAAAARLDGGATIPLPRREGLGEGRPTAALHNTLSTTQP